MILWSYLILTQEHVQLLHADAQIRLVELVRNVPAQRSKFPSLLDKRMEEAEAIQQLLEFSLYNSDNHHQLGTVRIQTSSPSCSPLVLPTGKCSTFLHSFSFVLPKELKAVTLQLSQGVSHPGSLEGQTSLASPAELCQTILWKPN